MRAIPGSCAALWLLTVVACGPKPPVSEEPPAASTASLDNREFAPKETGFGNGLALGLPIIYGVMGFIFTAIACAIYNFVAGFVGGIEVELEGERATT